jgi:hypothetical protein
MGKLCFVGDLLRAGKHHSMKRGPSSLRDLLTNKNGFHQREVSGKRETFAAGQSKVGPLSPIRKSSPKKNIVSRFESYPHIRLTAE